MITKLSPLTYQKLADHDRIPLSAINLMVLLIEFDGGVWESLIHSGAIG